MMMMINIYKITDFFGVKAAKTPMDSNVGRNLIKIIDAIPLLDPQTFDTLMTNQMNVRKSSFWPTPNL